VSNQSGKLWQKVGKGSEENLILETGPEHPKKRATAFKKEVETSHPHPTKKKTKKKGQTRPKDRLHTPKKVGIRE